MLAGCGVKRQVVESPVEVVEETPEWHTCLIQGTRARVIRDDETLASTVLMQTVRDSMIVISVLPMFGMEMMRLEITPLEIVGIDKVHGQYAEATFAEINRRLQPNLNWDIMQQICTAELPTGDRTARLFYTFGDEMIELVLDYGERQLDVPVRVMKQNTNRYTKIDISRWL